MLTIVDAYPFNYHVLFIPVLSRVKGFLPEMERADHELKDLLRTDQAKEALDIENTKEGDPCIEMVRKLWIEVIQIYSQ